MLIEDEAQMRTVEELREQGFPRLDWLAPQILPVKLKQIARTRRSHFQRLAVSAIYSSSPGTRRTKSGFWYLGLTIPNSSIAAFSADVSSAASTTPMKAPGDPLMGR
jgi:hypothetical protein